MRGLSNIVNSVFLLFLDKKYEKDFKLVSIIVLLGIYFLGIFMWGKFTSWGNVPLDFHDWSDITIPRIQLVRDAIRAGQLPLHMLDTSPLHFVTDRYLSLPDVITTPQMLLLLFIDVPEFIFLDILIHYTLGALSLFWFREKYKISLFSFAVLFLLFNFNGYILSHYAVGHFTWASYYLFPAFFMLIFNFLDGEQGWLWVTKVSFLLFYMVLSGGQHHYVWLLIFLGALMVTCWKRAQWILAVGFFSGLLNAIRFIPPALVLDVFQKKLIFQYVLGYPSIGHILTAMSWTRAPMNVPVVKYFDLDLYQSHYWEFNLYIGIIGTVFLLWGLYKWLKEQAPIYKELILPALVMVVFSLNSVYWLVRITEIPLFASERVAARMIGVPFVLLLLIATLFFDQYLKKGNYSLQQKLIGVFLIMFIFIDLWNNLKTWRLSSMATFFDKHSMDLTKPLIGNHPDPIYTTALTISAVIFLLTTIFLFTMSWKEKLKSR